MSRLLHLLLLALLTFTVTPAAAQNRASLDISPPEAPRETAFTLSFAGFQPGESVAVWFNRPDGGVFTINAVVTDMNPVRYEVRADQRGRASAEIFLDASYPAGAYSAVARGNRSQRQASVGFQLLADPWVTLSAQADPANPRRLALTASGFVGSETVALWITDPNGSASEVGRTRTSQGQFSLAIARPEQPGSYTITAYAPGSKRTGLASFTVAP